jgi:hypothetical protein
VQEIEDPDARCPDCGEAAYNHELGVLCTDIAAAARCYEAYAVAAEGLSERGEPLWPWEVLWRRSPRSAQAWVCPRSAGLRRYPGRRSGCAAAALGAGGPPIGR